MSFRAGAWRGNPWWIPPFLGRAPDVGEAKLKLLGVVSLALLFENYDQAVLTAALKQISESFALRESDLGGALGFVHLGAVPAFLLVPLADRVGRRRLFLASIVGVSLATFGSAFAQSVEQFVALQMIGRTFMVTCAATAFVVIAEELPAAARGWAVGIAGALGAFGHGLGLFLFAAIDVLPFGWRSMYVLGLVPVLMLPMFRRGVRETERFTRHREARDPDRGLVRGWWRPLASLARAHPGRAAAIGAIGALSAAAHSTAFNLSAYFVQSQHGWAPGQYTAMAVAGGMFGIIGHPFAGRLADRRGRRTVGFALFAAFPLLAVAFYHGPAWLLPMVWVPLIFTLSGGSTVARALAAELVPTSYRGTASGWLQLAEAVGRSAGLFAVYTGTAAGASNVPMVTVVVFACMLAGLVVLCVPETGGRELEQVSPELPAEPAAPVASPPVGAGGPALGRRP